MRRCARWHLPGLSRGLPLLWLRGHQRCGCPAGGDEAHAGLVDLPAADRRPGTDTRLSAADWAARHPRHPHAAGAPRRAGRRRRYRQPLARRRVLGHPTERFIAHLGPLRLGHRRHQRHRPRHRHLGHPRRGHTHRPLLTFSHPGPGRCPHHQGPRPGAPGGRRPLVQPGSQIRSSVGGRRFSLRLLDHHPGRRPPTEHPATLSRRCLVHRLRLVRSPDRRGRGDTGGLPGRRRAAVFLLTGLFVLQLWQRL